VEQCIVPLPSFDSPLLQLHVCGSEWLPRYNRNARIATRVFLPIPVCAWCNTAFATVARAYVFATSRLLQQVSKTGGWLELDGRLHYLFRMASAGGVAVLFVFVVAAAVVVSMRLVLALRRLLGIVGDGFRAYTGCRGGGIEVWVERLVARESRM
jgi:hypothetical protein